MPLVLAGATSGQATLQATDAQTVTLTLPASTGTLVVTGGAQTIEFADGSASAPSITNSGDTNTGMFFPAADTIAFSEGGAESMRIDASGNLLVGTTTATAGKLAVKGSDANTLWLVGRASDGTSSVSFRNNADSAYNSRIESFDTGVMTFGTGTSATERMRIDSLGNVGIGKVPGTSILDIAGEGQTGSNNMYLTWSTTSSGYGATLNLRKSNGTKTSPTAVANNDQVGVLVFAGYDGTNYQNTAYIESRVDGTPGANDMPGRMVFFTTPDGSTTPTERMRIDATGKVLIGCTSEPTNSVNGFKSDSQYTIMASSGQIALYVNRNANTGEIQQFRYNNGAVGNVSTNGSNCTFNSTSDYRLKENIAPMTGALDKVAQLKPVTYQWKKDGQDGEGFIAHELAEVCPEAVTGKKDAVELVDIKDEEGNVIGQEEKPVYQAIDQSVLVATLTAAIQELKATVDAQAARIAALEGAK